MNPIRSRLIAIAAPLALAGLSWVLPDGSPETAHELRRWLSYSLELALLGAGAWRERHRAFRSPPEPAKPALPAYTERCGDCGCDCHRRS